MLTDNSAEERTPKSFEQYMSKFLSRCGKYVTIDFDEIPADWVGGVATFLVQRPIIYINFYGKLSVNIAQAIYKILTESKQINNVEFEFEFAEFGSKEEAEAAAKLLVLGIQLSTTITEIKHCSTLPYSYVAKLLPAIANHKAIK
jgi:hypothetical protein